MQLDDAMLCDLQWRLMKLQIQESTNIRLLPHFNKHDGHGVMHAWSFMVAKGELRGVW